MIIGAAVGNIMATIMATQAARNSGMVIPMVGPALPVMPACRSTNTQQMVASVSNEIRMRLRCRLKRSELDRPIMAEPFRTAG